jgi:maltose alpha-D-glucosyltransferase/alpha-amylase
VLSTLPEAARADAQQVAGMEQQIFGCFQEILNRKLTALRTRCHGDYHLGQVLYTGNDFMIIDFEGEPAKSLTERRRKRSPLVDVAGMLRSFHYAAHTGLFREVENGLVRPEDVPALENRARFWYQWVTVTFLASYLETSSGAPFVPQTREETQAMLTAYMMDKAVYELGYELNNRPTWVRIPLWGILQLLEQNELA